MDEQILKTLESIEKLLRGTTSLPAPSLSSKAGVKTKIIDDNGVNKTFKALAVSTNDTNDAVLGLNKNLISLNTEVDKTTTNFGALNINMSRFMSTLGHLQTPESITPAAVNLTELQQKLMQALTSFSKIQPKPTKASINLDDLHIPTFKEWAEKQLTGVEQKLTLQTEAPTPALEFNELQKELLRLIGTVEKPQAQKSLEKLDLTSLQKEVQLTSNQFNELHGTVNELQQQLNQGIKNLDFSSPHARFVSALDALIADVKNLGTKLDISGVNVAIAKLATTLEQVQPVKSERYEPLTGAKLDLTSLQGEIAGTVNQFSKLQAALSVVQQQLNQGVKLPDLSTPLAAFIGALGGASRSTSINQQAANIMGGLNANLQHGVQPLSKTIDELNVPLQLVVGRMIDRFGRTATALGSLEVVSSHLAELTKQLTVDFLTLSRVGLGSISNLGTLYLNAAEAGMSLKEYTKLIEENIAAVTHVGSLDQFDKLAAAADRQLATMGIFGAEARGLQASLLQSSTVLGTSQADLTGVVSKQISVFDELHKSTNMTADSFASLVHSLSNNEQVQKELLGLAPQERANRQQELLQIATTGDRLGLTADASKRLADAMLEQRKATVQDRIEQAGVLRQLGAFTGFGGLGERAAELNLKGRRRTAAEDDELRQIVGTLDQASQTLYETGTLGTQNVLDQFDKMIGGGLGNIINANRTAELTSTSGPADQNKDFAKHVGEFGQFVGKLTAWTRGLQESITGPIAGAVGGALLFFFRGPVVSLLSGMLGKLGIGTGVSTVGAEATAAGTMFSKLLSPVKELKDGAVGLFSSLTKLPQTFAAWIKGLQVFNLTDGPLAAAKAVMSDVAGVLKGGLGIFINGISAITKAFGPAAGFIDAAIEAFTGDIADALNPNGGFIDRLGGIATAFFGAIPNLLIGVIGYIFGDNLGKQLQNGFDTFVAAANGTIRQLFGKMFEGWANILSYVLPNDSELVKSLKAWGQGAQESAQQNFDVMGQLWDDQSKTLKSISAANEKSATSTNKAAEAATTRAATAQAKFNNVQYADTLSAAGLVNDAAVLAQPQVQVPQPVVQAAAVNNEQPTPPSSQTVTAAPNNTQELMNTLNAILQVMRDNLAAETRQADNSDALLRAAKPSVSFMPAEQITNQLLKRGYV